MIQVLLLLAFLWSVDGGGLDGRLPDNTFLVVSGNPRALAGTPAFAAIKKNLLRAAALEKPMAELESIAGIRFFSDVYEVSLVMPVDFELRENVMVLIRGDLRLGGLLELASAKGMGIEDCDAAGGCILTIPGRKDLAVGILEDGSVMLASKRTIETRGAVKAVPRGNRLDPVMNSALTDADWESMIWGAVVVPPAYATAAAAGTGLPLTRIERAHFRVDAAYDFFVDIRIVLKDGMLPETFIEVVRKELGLGTAPEPGTDAAGAGPRKKTSVSKKSGKEETRRTWMPEDFKMESAGTNGVSVSFRITASRANEFLGSMKK